MLDTNVILDATIRSTDASAAARDILRLIADDGADGMLTANCVADFFYLVSSIESMDTANEALTMLFSILSIVEVSDVDCYRALGLAIHDFEDALLVVCAGKENVDALITSDKKLLNQPADVSILSPEQFLKAVRLN
jgi:predicted nucleic acid-binding protein